MAKRTEEVKEGGLYVTSVKLYRVLAQRAQDLATKNERAKSGRDDAFYVVLNNALREYLKRKGA